MASLEKPITDAFELVYPSATSGPAAEFLKDGSDANLARALALTEYVALNRRGLNPYREDMVEKMKETEFFAGVSDNELEATRSMLMLLAKVRASAKAKEGTVKLAEALKIANKVEAPAVVKIEEEKSGKEKIEEKVDPKGS